jgi:hypothetical protein
VKRKSEGCRFLILTVKYRILVLYCHLHARPEKSKSLSCESALVSVFSASLRETNGVLLVASRFEPSERILGGRPASRL